MNFLKKTVFILSLSILPLACLSNSEDHTFLEMPKMNEKEVELECRRWRVSLEENNIRDPWKRIPEECGEYVKEYMNGKGYEDDLERVSNEALMYGRSVILSEDGKDCWIFDVDETLLSNLPYYAQHGYGLEIFDSTKFDQWVETGLAPAIESSLKLYDEVLRLGFKVVLLTGRSQRYLSITTDNLSRAGFREWDKLILRSLEDHEKTATKYKSDKRNELVQEGYRIIGNYGDQWSDLLGSSISIRSFKLSNPMYYIP